MFFAVDTVLYHSSNSFENSLSKLQNDLNLVNFWCRKNCLEIDASKTKSMYFSSKYLNSSAKFKKKLQIGNSDLQYVQTYRYLSVTFDANLSFTPNLKNTIKSILYRVSKLEKIRNFLA